MNGWQEPKNGKRIYLITDNSKMDDFTDYIRSEDIDRLYVTYSESRVNLGIHYYHNSLYSSNLVGICRVKSVDDETLYDADGNELLLKVVPRFNVTVIGLLNYIKDDDEFDRYMAPQTISNRHKEKDIESIDRNEIFYFFENEKPLKVDDGISEENSIIVMADVLTPEQRRKNMQHIKSNDTKIEVLLRKALWKKGYRFRKNYKELPGKPDIVLTKYKIAIFCDGEFFHGKDWEVLKPRLEKSNNSEFWISKISRNRERDDEINKKLLFLGWTVIRFWGNDIKKNTEECVKVIEETVFDLKMGEMTVDKPLYTDN